MRSRQWATISSLLTRASGLSTITACTVSPHLLQGMPITAPWATAGWLAMAVSTSAE
ncbi:hypothetical protein FQZ97_1279530 [compost metagenome]